LIKKAMMNDYDILDSAFDDENNHDNTDEISVLKTLINLVRPNLILYKKNTNNTVTKIKKMIWK